MKLLTVVLSFFCATSACWADASRSFDGTGDEVAYGNNLDVTTNDASWCAWVKSTEDAGTDWFSGKGVSFSAAGYILAQTNTDFMRCNVHDGTDAVALNAASGTDTDGSWRLLCCTWNAATSTLTEFNNGTQEESGTNTAVGSLSNINNFLAGQSDTVGNIDANGLIAYAHVYLSRVLTAIELAELQYRVDPLGTESACLPLLGDATEIDWGPSDFSGTVANATTSTDGPPVMIGDMPL